MQEVRRKAEVKSAQRARRKARNRKEGRGEAGDTWQTKGTSEIQCEFIQGGMGEERKTSNERERQEERQKQGNGKEELEKKTVNGWGGETGIGKVGAMELREREKEK